MNGRCGDLTQQAQVVELVAWCESIWGQIDVLVNNAGIAIQGDAEPFTELPKVSLDA
jgi:3-oxoacyl-[acyl-carrier protein] reductase